MRTQRKSPLVGLLQLAAVVVAVWLGVTEGWPWLKERLDRSSATPTAVRSAGGGGDEGESESEELNEASRCVDLAGSASASLAGSLRSLGRPPYDRSAWAAASLDAADALGEADRACLCGHPACREAAAAVSALREELSMAEGMVRGESGGNLAVMRERADEHLNRAGDLLR